jgi:hypothetical protein
MATNNQSPGVMKIAQCCEGNVRKITVSPWGSIRQARFRLQYAFGLGIFIDAMHALRV